MNLKRVCQVFTCVVALTAALAFSSFAFSAQGGKVTSNGSLNLRAKASTSSSVLTRLPSGTKVLVLEDKGSWYKVAYNGMIGYVSDDYISLSSTMDLSVGYAKITSNGKLNMRSGAGTSYDVLTKLPSGSTAEILGISKGWVKVKYKTYTGYISAEYITVVATGNGDETNDSGSNSGSGTNTPATSGLKITSSGNLRMRSGPGTNYSIVTSLKRGTIVKNLGASGSWYKVQYGNYTGYVSGDYVTEAEYTDSSNTGGSSGGNTGNETSYDGVKITSSGRLNMRKGAGTSYGIVAKLPSGAVAKLVSTHGDWYKVTYKGDTGYISAEYCKLVDYDSSVSNEDTSTSSSTREKVVAYAKTFLGTKYVYGGTKPSTGFDCSGYVKYVLAKYGYSIPRTSSSQYSGTTRIKKSELKLGDLIFFGSSGKVNHVGMYIGNNNFIHAENKDTGVCISSLSSSYYSSHYIGCGRVIKD
jgi:cell wall-associated NlpC family hydrolase